MYTPGTYCHFMGFKMCAEKVCCINNTAFEGSLSIDFNGKFQVKVNLYVAMLKF